MWNENISWHINKQKMSQPIGISGPQMWMRAHQSGIQQMPPPRTVTAEKLGNARISHLPQLPLLNVNKETEFGPRQPKCNERNGFSESKGWHFPIPRTLSSLTWYLIFDVQNDCSLCCKLVYSLTPPPASLKQFSQSYWDAVSPAWGPKHSHQIK